MGAVYQANDTRLVGKLWAIKEMSDASLTDPNERANAVAAFQREAQLLASLDHANLPKVSDFFQEQGKHYLVMDFVQGQTLEAVVETTTGFLSETTVMEWMEQLCDVLDYLHTRQPPIIFRDLKPANIMLTPENKIKLIDFGIARLFRPGKSKDTAQYGTIGFASPEQFGTGQTDARSDIYSLGVLLHHLLTRYDPSLSPFNLPPARNINASVSPQLADVVIRATQAAPHERFQTTKELKQGLQSKIPTTISIPSTLPIPAVQKMQVTPYIFAPGKVANTLEELVRLCEQDWERAVQQFYDGYFVKWLESIGEFGLASEAKKISTQKRGNLNERATDLQKWLDLTNVPNISPKLGPMAPRIDLDFSNVDLSKQKFLQMPPLAFQNVGRGLLSVKLNSPAAWLAFSPSSFVCAPNNLTTVNVHIDLELAAQNNLAQTQIAITSNALSFEIPISIRGISPVLDVSPLTLDFGTIGSFSFSLRDARITITNKGQGLLSGDIFVDPTDSWLWLWEYDHIRRFKFQGNRKEVLVVIDPKKVANIRGIHNGLVIIETNGGTKTVQIQVERV